MQCRERLWRSVHDRLTSLANVPSRPPNSNNPPPTSAEIPCCCNAGLACECKARSHPSAPSDRQEPDDGPNVSRMALAVRERIVPLQKAPPQRPCHHMHDRNLIRRKHFHTCQSSHISNPFITPSCHSALSTCHKENIIRILWRVK